MKAMAATLTPERAMMTTLGALGTIDRHPKCKCNKSFMIILDSGLYD
jgi:hypothetical protein